MCLIRSYSLNRCRSFGHLAWDAFPNKFQELLAATVLIGYEEVREVQNDVDIFYHHGEYAEARTAHAPTRRMGNKSFFFVWPSCFRTVNLTPTVSPLNRLNEKKLLMALDRGIFIQE